MKRETKDVLAVLDSVRHGIVTLDENLATLVECPRADALLRKFFPTGSNPLPEEILSRAKSHLSQLQTEEFYVPPAPFEIETDKGSLRIRLTYHHMSRSSALLIEEVQSSAERLYLKYKITPRESEVLKW